MRWLGTAGFQLEHVTVTKAAEDAAESVEVNTAMLVNLIDTLEPVAPLQHVHAVHGSKYYGHQLGPVPLPMVENQSRANNQNFYFNQLDFLIARTRNAKWSANVR